MSRYFVASGWEGDYEHWEPHWEDSIVSSITVSDHEPTETGVLDGLGRMIMKQPRPIGFGRDKDW